MTPAYAPACIATCSEAPCSRSSATKFSSAINLPTQCRRTADETDDLSKKQDYLNMAERWLHLARSPAFLEQISNFNAATRRLRPPESVSRPPPKNINPPRASSCRRKGRLGAPPAGGTWVSIPPASGRATCRRHRRPRLHRRRWTIRGPKLAPWLLLNRKWSSPSCGKSTPRGGRSKQRDY